VLNLFLFATLELRLLLIGKNSGQLTPDFLLQGTHGLLAFSKLLLLVLGYLGRGFSGSPELLAFLSRSLCSPRSGPFFDRR
jgi:hypothetical protein